MLVAVLEEQLKRAPADSWLLKVDLLWAHARLAKLCLKEGNSEQYTMHLARALAYDKELHPEHPAGEKELLEGLDKLEKPRSSTLTN